MAIILHPSFLSEVDFDGVVEACDNRSILGSALPYQPPSAKILKSAWTSSKAAANVGLSAGGKKGSSAIDRSSELCSRIGTPRMI